jgi:hypothetical protein
MMDSVAEKEITESECTGLYLVRVGFQKNVIPVQAGVVELVRGDQIICRTSRGVEMGEVLAATHPEQIATSDASKFIRKSRPEDALLWRQLTTLSVDANEACQAFLQKQSSRDVLLEVEPLIDGRTLYFHFLGNPSLETEQHVQELAEIYQKSVASSRFAALLEHGCGPGCGTKEKSGCGTGGGCAVCAIAGGCTATARTTST